MHSRLPEGSNSQATFYNWRKYYMGLLPSEVKQLRQLAEATGKLKRIVPDPSLEIVMSQDDLSKRPLKPARRRQLVDYVTAIWKSPSGRSRRGRGQRTGSR